MAYSTQRQPGREHVPNYPRGFVAIRILQLILVLVIIGLDAYGLSLIVFGGAGLNMFTGIITLIVCIWHIAAHFGAPGAYNYWASLALDIFLVIFWLISFSLMAAQIAPYFVYYSSYYDYDSYYSGYNYNYSYGLSGTAKVFTAAMAAVAGLGGLQFILFIIAMAITALYIHRHRAAGLHSRPGIAPTTTVSGEKPPGLAVYGGAPQQPAPVYGAYPQQQQQHQYGPPPQATPAPVYGPQQVPYQPYPQQTGGSFQQQHPQLQQGMIHPQQTGGSYHPPQQQQQQQHPIQPQHTGPPAPELQGQQVAYQHAP